MNDRIIHFFELFNQFVFFKRTRVKSIMDVSNEPAQIIGALNEKIQELTQENENLKNQTSLSVESFSELEEIAKSTNLMSGSPSHGFSSFQNHQIEQLQSQIRSSEEKIKQLELDLQNEQKENVDKSEALRKSHEQLEELLHTAVSFSTQNHEKSKTFDEVMKDQTLLRQQLQTSLTQNDYLLSENERLTNQIYQLKQSHLKEIEEIETKYSELNTVITSLKSLCNVSKSYDIIPAVRSLTASLNDTSNLRQQLNMANKRAEDQELRAKLLEENPKTVEVPLQADKSKIAELQSQVNSLNIQLHAQSETEEKLRSEMESRYKYQIDQLKSQIDSQKNTVLKLSNENIQLTEENSRIKKQVDIQSNQKTETVTDDTIRTNSEIYVLAEKVLSELHDLNRHTVLSDAIEDVIAAMIMKDPELKLDFDASFETLKHELAEHFLIGQYCELLNQLIEKYSEFGSQFIEKMDELEKKQGNLSTKFGLYQRIINSKSSTRSTERRAGISRIPIPVRKSIGPDTRITHHFESSKTPFGFSKGTKPIFT